MNALGDSTEGLCHTSNGTDHKAGIQYGVRIWKAHYASKKQIAIKHLESPGLLNRRHWTFDIHSTV